MGLAIHESATENLEKAHADVQAEIKHFAEESSKTLAQSRDLYANIEYPLSKTLCDSDDHPRASLEVHLNRLKQDIAAAREQVVRLSAEWEECCRTEEEAWDELKNGLEHRGRGATGMDEETKVAAEEFKKEARAIVEANCQLLDEIDQVCYTFITNWEILTDPGRTLKVRSRKKPKRSWRVCSLVSDRCHVTTMYK